MLVLMQEGTFIHRKWERKLVVIVGTGWGF